MNLNFWPKMYGAGGGGGGGGAGGGSGSSGSAGSSGSGSSSYYASSGEQSPIQPTPVGAFRFNTDTAKLEYYDGNQWVNVTTRSPESETGGTRGVTAGINVSPNWQEYMSFFNISTTGNGTDFGDMSADIFGCGATASSTRGLVIGGYGGSTQNSNNNQIEFVTIASQGNSQDFGDMTVGRSNSCVSGNQTRAVAVCGAKTPGTSNVMDYVTIASTGNAVDFGDHYEEDSNSSDGGCGSPTRGICHLRTPGNNGNFYYYNISSTGNTAEFSEKAISGNNTLAGGSNAIRGLFQGAYNGNGITAVTISTLGSAFDFGDQTTTRYTAGAAASGTRYVTIGGAGVPSYTMHNTMEYVQIMTQGNTIDFGDLSFSGYYITGMSNGHGGLG